MEGERGSLEQSIKDLPLSSTRAMLNLSVAIDTSRKNIDPPGALANIAFCLQLATLTYISLTAIYISPSSPLEEKEVQRLPATNNLSI